MPVSPSNFDAVILGSLKSPWGPDTSLSVEPWPRSNREPSPDFKVELRWGERTFTFAAEAKSRSTPATLEQAADQARRFAETTGLLPMVIVPYLSEPALDRLAERSVSGLDLSGNGVAMAPGVLYLRRSGQPNRYPESQPMRYAYRGATSVVPRVFLCRREFESVSAIKSEIEARGGTVALSTVSKALARMTEDVIVRRSEGRISLVQPNALLDRLRESFERTPRLATARLTCEDLPEFFKRVNAEARPPHLVLSGATSQERYTAGRRSDTPLAWCSNLSKARSIAGDLWRESERFVDLEVVQAKDGTPFFDARRDSSGIAYASPVQTYLELAVGDKRDQEAATEIRQSILKSIG